MNIKLNTICFILLLFLIIGLVSACDINEKIVGKIDSYNNQNLSTYIDLKLVTSSGTDYDLSDIVENEQLYWRFSFFNNNKVDKYKKKYYNLKRKSRNKNFKKNEKNMSEIMHEVSIMLEEKINRQAHDYISTINGEAFPDINHKILGIPGIFKGLYSSRGHTQNGRHKYMDLIELIEPDGKVVTKESIANVEYVISKLDNEVLFDYDLSSILKYKKRIFHIVVVNKDMGVPEEIIEVSGHPIKVLYRVFDEIRQWKVLCRLAEKTNNNKEITVEDYIELVHCIANSVNPHAKEYIEECVDLFTRIDNIDSTYQSNMHLSLKIMIKFIFEDDIEKTEELLMMITKALPFKSYRGISSYEEAITRAHDLEIEVGELNDKLSKKDNRILELEEQLKNSKQ